MVSSWSREFNVESLLSPSVEHVDDGDDMLDEKQFIEQHQQQDEQKYDDIVPKPLDAPQMDDDVST